MELKLNTTVVWETETSRRHLPAINLIDFDDSPCAGCGSRAFCAASGAECPAYKSYEQTGLWVESDSREAA